MYEDVNMMTCVHAEMIWLSGVLEPLYKGQCCPLLRVAGIVIVASYRASPGCPLPLLSTIYRTCPLF